MKNLILKHPEIESLLTEHKLVLVDGGARGKLFSPFHKIDPKIVQAIRFEPDSKAEFETTDGRDIVVNKALWNKSKTIPINIAIAPTTSSVYPFNRDLQKHIDPFYERRNTERTVEVEAISLDEYQASSKTPKIDFIKLDIHGAEFEALEGGEKTMRGALGLLVESWVIPIHKGQKTRAAVELLAYDRGFYAVEENHRSLWMRKGPDIRKRQPVSLDTFFLKDPIIDHNITDYLDAIKFIGIADLFRHHNYVLQLIDYFEKREILDSTWVNLMRTMALKNAQISKREKKRIEWLEKIKRRLDNRAF